MEHDNEVSFLSSNFSSYKSDKPPSAYEEGYVKLYKFIDSSLDAYKYELYTLTYPVFVHMYLELVYNRHEEAAKKFMDKFGPHQEDYYQDDIRKLTIVTKPEQMKDSEIVDNFTNGQPFTVRLSRDTYYYLKRYLQDSNNSNPTIQNIIQEHLFLDVYEGLTRNKQQVESSFGGMMGEAPREANKAKVYIGLLKEPDINLSILDDDNEEGAADNPGEGGEKPKKKKSKKDNLLAKRSRNDPNAPPLTRIPLPELRDAEKLDKIQQMREATKRLKLSSETLPSICFYTLLNANLNNNIVVLCVEISEDSALLAAGLSDSTIKVWSLTPNKLKTMKSSQDLEMIDREADDVLYRMMDDKSTSDVKVLHGHSGPVYALSFSPDRNLLLSCSEDSTIRLWSLQTWTNICCYKGHCFPVWDVVFSPHGYYFASCGHDRTARLWATDSHQPLRFFVGHLSDVDCLQFHPNSNYIVTGSTDRCIRLWDVLTGQCVRYFTGHKGKVYVVTFTNCGRYLVSSGEDKRILLWDLAHGYLVANLNGHTETVYSLSISRDGAILASGGADDCITLWDMTRLIDETDVEDLNMSQAPSVRTNTDKILLKSFRTKNTSILTIHFTRRNLVLAAGVFH